MVTAYINSCVKKQLIRKLYFINWPDVMMGAVRSLWRRNEFLYIIILSYLDEFRAWEG